MDAFEPLKRLSNPDNIIDRITEAEKANLVQPTQIGNNLEEMAGNTGDLIVGNLISPAPEVEVMDVTSTDFTGSFMSGEGATFGSDVYNIGGVNSGVLQFGLSQTNGKAYAGAGAVTIDENGITVAQTSSTPGIPNIIKVGNIEIYDATSGGGSESVIQNADTAAAGENRAILLRSQNSGIVDFNICEIFAQSSTDNANITIGNLYGNTGSVKSATISMILNSSSANIFINQDSGDVDTVIKGDTATNLLVIDAGLDAVQVGNTTAGVIADFRNSGIVFNEDGSDRDLRVETDGNANTLFVDGGNNRVGILNGAPTVALDVTGEVTASSSITSNAFFNMGATNAQTINAGVITVTGGRCIVDTQGGAATDDLDTINGGADGDILVIYTANSARDVTAKDGTGNLALAGDFIMTNIRDRLVLLKDSGTWVELSRSDNQ